MQEFARLPDSERLEIFRECANRRGIRELIIEKDFWVCWVIEQLFSLKELSGYFTFKGGTSLSKAYGLIERFSEDIDLTIDRRAQLLCDVPNPIETDISGNERKRRIASLKVATQQFLVDVILPTLTQAIHTSIQNINSWNLKLDQQDRELQTLVFEYPQIVDLGSGYIRPSIRLEFGARGAISPVEKRSISSYAALDFPKLFQRNMTEVTTLAAVRTFWEKATILHALYHGCKLRDRMSRHYYDLFSMSEKGVAETALDQSDLLAQVAHEKSILFRDTKASYDTATLTGLKLVPSNENLPTLRKDYKAMHEMFMADEPGFDTVIMALEVLEKKIQAT